MARRCLAALDLHELVELEDATLTAAVALAALVEDGGARVVDAVLVIGARLTLLVGGVASFPLAWLGVGYLEIGLVVFGLGGGWRCCRCGLGRERGAAGCRRDGLGQLVRERLSSGVYIGDEFLLFDLGRVIGGAVLALCTGVDLEEFVEGEDPRLAAFPS